MPVQHLAYSIETGLLMMCRILVSLRSIGSAKMLYERPGREQAISAFTATREAKAEVQPLAICIIGEENAASYGQGPRGEDDQATLFRVICCHC